MEDKRKAFVAALKRYIRVVADNNRPSEAVVEVEEDLLIALNELLP